MCQGAKSEPTQSGATGVGVLVRDLAGAPLWLKLVIGVLGLIAVVKVQHGVQNAIASSIDLRLQYVSASLLTSGENPWREYLRTRKSLEPVQQNAESLQRVDDLVPTYPPSALAILAVILQPWDYHALKVGWAVVNWCVWAFVIHAVWRLYFAGSATWPSLAWLCILVLGFAMRPVHHSIGNGQFGIFAFGWILASRLLVKQCKPYWAGLALAMGLIKPSLTLPFLALYLIRRQWVPLVVAGSVHGVLTVGVALWLGTMPWDVVAEWLQVSGPMLRENGTLDVAFLAGVFGLSHTMETILSLGYLGAAVVVTWRCRQAGEREIMAFLAMIALTWTYHALYDYVVVVLPVLMALQTLGAGRWRGAAGWQLPRMLGDWRAWCTAALVLVVVVPAKIPPIWYDEHYLAVWGVLVCGLLAFSVVTMWTRSAADGHGRAVYGIETT